MSIVHLASVEFPLGTETSGGTFAWPSSTESGDYGEVVIVSRAHDSGLAVPTCVDTDSGGNTFTLKGSTQLRKGHLYWKRATSATAGKVVTISGCSNSAAAGMSVFRGVYGSGDPISDWTTRLIEGVDPKVHPGFTPAYDDSMVRLTVFNHTNNINVSDLTCTNPGSLEPEFFEAPSTGGNDCAVITTGAPQMGSATTTGSFTWTQSANQVRTMAWSLRPAPPSSATTVEPPSSTSQSPVHVFGAAGAYVVSLTVTDGLGRSATTSSVVTVS